MPQHHTDEGSSTEGEVPTAAAVTERRRVRGGGGKGGGSRWGGCGLLHGGVWEEIAL
eukprot:CAMPEP_0169469062 /NCGR_PEP_ID=MMETSP1042-20121227/23266_1 /TAXON_ID=464988 /ORGANISM="Hemiselmis andersenii, Strain CCMP1180" /LENGTH=56 /DNA_ID=CAMNT_0009582487 /DNA_START=87 /DNA_END=257 /DNA_ORIENTATION=-